MCRPQNKGFRQSFSGKTVRSHGRNRWLYRVMSALSTKTGLAPDKAPLERPSFKPTRKWIQTSGISQVLMASIADG